jgi:hypothetical protein
MEDKWFVYRDKNEIRFHRSWTGFCVFVVLLRPGEAGASVEKVEVNRDRDQYGSENDQEDIQQLAYLIDALLLGRDVEFPRLGSAPAALQALTQWSVAGRTMLTGKGGRKRGKALEKALEKAAGPEKPD